MRASVIAALIQLAAGCGSDARPAPDGGAPPDAGSVDASGSVDAGGSDDAVFVMSDETGVYTLDADGGGRRDLRAGGLAPSWTPDGRIVFSADDQLHIMNADGSDDHAIPNPPGYRVALRPVMAVDGTIVFMAFESPGGTGDVWVTREDGTGQREVVAGDGGPPQPFVARSGEWFVYMVQTSRPAGSSPPYHREVWRRNIDGSGAMALTNSDDTPDYPDANAPSISPDERMVAFFSGTESDDTDPTGGDPSTWGISTVRWRPGSRGCRRCWSAPSRRSRRCSCARPRGGTGGCFPPAARSGPCRRTTPPSARQTAAAVRRLRRPPRAARFRPRG